MRDMTRDHMQKCINALLYFRDHSWPQAKNSTFGFCVFDVWRVMLCKNWKKNLGQTFYIFLPNVLLKNFIKFLKKREKRDAWSMFICYDDVMMMFWWCFDDVVECVILWWWFLFFFVLFCKSLQFFVRFCKIFVNFYNFPDRGYWEINFPDRGYWEIKKINENVFLCHVIMWCLMMWWNVGLM